MALELRDTAFVRKAAYNAYVQQFVAPVLMNAAELCIVRFSDFPDRDEVWLGAGTELGGVFYSRPDAFAEQLQKGAVQLSQHAITDVHFTPDRRTLLAMSMVGELFVLDTETQVVRQRLCSDGHAVFAGHSGDSNCFVVAEKSSNIVKFVDLRRSQAAIASARPREVLTPKRSAHRSPRRPNGTPKTPRTPLGSTTPRTPRTPAAAPSPLKANPTCVKHLDDKLFAVGYNKAEKGVLVWDMKYVKSDAPYQTLRVQSENRQNFGVASMSLNGPRSSLYVLCTDGEIRDYPTGVFVNAPARDSRPLDSCNAFTGAAKGDFQLEFGVSPFSEHLVCGTDSGAGIWSLKVSPPTSMCMSQNPAADGGPSYGLKYISGKMVSCDWSRNGRYIAGISRSDIESFVVLYDNLSAKAGESGVPINHSYPYLLSNNTPR